MDYNNGKIYQLLNNVNDEVYIGSTTQPLCKRLYCHKSHSKEYGTSKLYQSMRTIGKDNFYIELIELYPCNSKEELSAREGHFIRERGTLNQIIAGRTRNEYLIDNKEHIKEQKKQYDENRKEQAKQYVEAHKEHIAERMNKYREDNKEHLKERNKQFYEDNKQKYLERSKQYHENNKERIKQYNSEKVICNICGCEVQRGSISIHKKSIRCKSYVKPSENDTSKNKPILR